MTITGLENNYYLSQNDIWIKVNGFENPVSVLELKVTNLTTAKELPFFKLSASPDNDFEFNISVPVSALFPNPDHKNINTMQSFQFDLRVRFVDTGIEHDTQSIFRYFVLGGRNKNGNEEWFLTSSEELVRGKWIEWTGITLPDYPKRIQGSEIVNFISSNVYTRTISNCDYKILKFRNSIGGYQFFVFEKFEIKQKSKAGKTIPKIVNLLRENNFRNLPNQTTRTIELFTKTPFEIQDVFSDLVNSNEVYLFHPTGSDNNAKWELLQLENNDSIENNFDRVYENKIEFSFSNYISKRL